MNTTALFFAVGTLASWLGWFFAIRLAITLAQFVTRAEGPGRARAGSSIAKIAGFAAVSFVVAAVLLSPPAAKEQGWRLPLTWFVMPFSAWLVVVGLIMAAVRFANLSTAISDLDKKRFSNSALGWLGAAGAFGVIYRLDPQNKITILNGGIMFTPAKAVAIAALAVAAIFAMVAASKATKTRGWAQNIVIQLTLIAGTVVFGLPFAFLVITSFKEDRDMASPTGIVWVPKVAETVPYFNKKDPLYEGTYDGKTVQGTVLDKLAGDKVRIDILKPQAIRGTTFETSLAAIKEVPRDIPVVEVKVGNETVKGKVVEDLDDGRKRVEFLSPTATSGKEGIFLPNLVEPVRHVGLRFQNYPDALSYLPPETNNGLVYLKNTLILVILNVFGTIASSSIVAYAFSRLKFPGKTILFNVVLSTMMLPAAVTLLPQFLIFRSLGWIDTLYPLWVPAFFGSAFNIFLLRQFFLNIPMELEDAAKIDGCSYLRTFWDIMVPQIKPALAVITVGTFLGAWNNFMGPLIYINSPENMPLSYALQLFQGDRSGEPGLLMAFATLSMFPVLALFFFAQKYFIESVTLSGLGGR